MMVSCVSDTAKCKKRPRVYQREDGDVYLRCPCGFGCIAWPELRERFLERQKV